MKRGIQEGPKAREKPEVGGQRSEVGERSRGKVAEGKRQKIEFILITHWAFLLN